MKYEVNKHFDINLFLKDIYLHEEAKLNRYDKIWSNEESIRTRIVR